MNGRGVDGDALYRRRFALSLPPVTERVVPVSRNTRRDGDDTNFWQRLADRTDFDPYGIER